jgi:hypothetical protein
MFRVPRTMERRYGLFELLLSSAKFYEAGVDEFGFLKNLFHE